MSNLNSMCGQLTQRQSAFEQQTHAINKKMDLLLKHLGKHEIGYMLMKLFEHTLGHHTLGVQVLLNSQMVCMTIWVK